VQHYSTAVKCKEETFITYIHETISKLLVRYIPQAMKNVTLYFQL